MPRLPDANDLGAVDYRSARQAVNVPTPDIAGAMNNLARGVSDVGEAAMRQAQSSDEKMKLQERFDTRMGLLKVKENIATKLQDLDPLDPQFPDKVRGVYKDNYAPVLLAVQHPDNQQYFSTEAYGDYVSAGSEADAAQKKAFAGKAELDLDALTEADQRRIRNGEDPQKVLGDNLAAVNENGYIDNLSKEKIARKNRQALIVGALTHLGSGQYGKLSGGAVVRAVIGAETGGDPTAVSPKGALGLMQVMPETAAEIAAEIGDTTFLNLPEAKRKAYLQDKDVSIRYGTYYLNKMLKRYDGDLEAALIAYNAGPGRADDWIAAGRDWEAVKRANPKATWMNEAQPYVGKIFGTLGINPQQASTDPRLIASKDDVIYIIKENPLYRELPVDTADELTTGLTTEIDKAETEQRKSIRDAIDLGIEQGTVTRQQIEQSPIEDGDKAVLIRRLEERQRDAVNVADFMGRLAEGTVNPKDTGDRKMVGKLLDGIGGGRGIMTGDPSAVGAMYELYDKTGIVPDNAKGAVDAMLRSKEPAKVTTALSYLAELDRRNHRAFQQEFDDDTERLMTQYRDSLDYATPEEAAAEVMKAKDPANEFIRAERGKVAEKAASKFTVATVRDKFDTTILPLPEPEISPAKGAEDAIMLDYQKLYVEAYKQTGDEKQAQKTAAALLTRTWGVSAANRGTIMKWPPEALYGPGAMVNGSFDWMASEVDDLLKARGYERTFASPVLDTTGNVTGATEETRVAPHFLLADAQTLAEHQSGKPPSYQVWVMDENGHYDVVPARIYFDPAEARSKMAPALEKDRQKNLETRNASEAELARQQVSGVAPIPGGDPLTSGGGAGLAPANLNELLGAR